MSSDRRVSGRKGSSLGFWYLQLFRVQKLSPVLSYTQKPQINKIKQKTEEAKNNSIAYLYFL